jgi:hypothetical protein
MIQSQLFSRNALSKTSPLAGEDRKTYDLALAKF